VTDKAIESNLFSPINEENEEERKKKKKTPQSV
jgi:hypothetical protein